MHTKYRVGSVSKMFTAVMIFQLVEEGKLTLSQKLATYFPQLSNAGILPLLCYVTAFTINDFMDITGTFSFAVAGALAAMEKRLDPFGVLILAFVTAIGGGTIRDLLLGIHPVSWLQDLRTASVILIAALLALIFAHRLHKFSKLLNLFDALGLGFFTLVGINKAMATGLAPGFCIALGTITGCFGGVIRDVLLNNVPLVFRKEVYASASIAGGITFYILHAITSPVISFMAGVLVVVAIRLLALHFQWSLPSWYGKDGNR